MYWIKVSRHTVTGQIKVLDIREDPSLCDFLFIYSFIYLFLWPGNQAAGLMLLSTLPCTPTIFVLACSHSVMLWWTSDFTKQSFKTTSSFVMYSSDSWQSEDSFLSNFTLTLLWLSQILVLFPPDIQIEKYVLCLTMIVHSASQCSDCKVKSGWCKHT